MKANKYRILFFVSLAPGVVYLSAVALELLGFSIFPDISDIEAFLYSLLIFFVEFPICALFFFKWSEHKEKYVPTNEEKLRKAPRILAADFKKNMEECTFFINHNYDQPYTQSQWAELYKELNAKNDPQALIPMYNAIAVNSHGRILRRGLEKNLDGISHFSIDSTDKLSDKHAVEPYTYQKKYTLLQCAEFYEAHPQWARKIPVSSHSSSGQSSYTAYRAPARNQPAKRQELHAWERAELNNAKHRYMHAVDEAKRHPESARIYESLEKKAHADYMRVLTKYAGRE